MNIVLFLGPKGESLCVGEQHVYALTQRREIVVRGGITKKNLCGDNWNKIPGSLFSISGNIFCVLLSFPVGVIFTLI